MAGLDGHGDATPGPGWRGQAPHLHAVRTPDHPRKVLPALLARGTYARVVNKLRYLCAIFLIYF